MAGQYAVYDPSAIIRMKMQEKELKQQDKQHTINSVIAAAGVASNAYLRRRELGVAEKRGEAQDRYSDAMTDRIILANEKEKNTRNFVAEIDADPEGHGFNAAQWKIASTQYKLTGILNEEAMGKMVTKGNIAGIATGSLADTSGRKLLTPEEIKALATPTAPAVPTAATKEPAFTPEMLRNDPAFLAPSGNPDAQNPAGYGKRLDGSPKGRGFFGILPVLDPATRKDTGTYSSELTVGLNIDGKETEIPTYNPKQSPEDIRFLQVDGLRRWPKSAQAERIYRNSAAWAKDRAQLGLSPFALPEEEGLYRSMLEQ